MIQFNLFGVNVRVEIWFWVILAVIGGGLQASNTEDLLLVAMFVLAGFISVLVHEMGHALMIRKYGQPTRVVLSAFGGYASYPAGALTRKKSFLVTAAGPVAQLGFAGLIIIVTDYLPKGGGQLGYFIFYLKWVSIVWALFNCLPICPLDGGRMLGSILGPRREKVLFLTGVITAFVIGLCALYFKQLYITLFMGLFVYQNYQSYKQASC